jgi:geranylgeranyl diphosphate synthase type II
LTRSSFRFVDAPDIESLLEDAFDRVTGPSTPPRLRAAMRAAVFSGGGRVRPRLVVQVAAAGPAPDAEAAVVAAASIEFLHCASLVHDDLPCFDDAAIRRGRPSVHAEFGEALAVLAGDGLITGAFELLTQLGAHRALPGLLAVISGSVGATRGIVAGQAWESEPNPNLRLYHRAKTGALFEGAFAAGALAGGDEPRAWVELGRRLGEAYQIADDLSDRHADAAELGKPTGQDARLQRPNAVDELGTYAAHDRLRSLVGGLLGAVPEVPGRDAFTRWLGAVCARVLGPVDEHTGPDAPPSHGGRLPSPHAAAMTA